MWKILESKQKGSPMPRCDYDVIFYRVFCITLLAIALTFTVILTNVFVDIDGLLSNEEKAKTHSPPKLEIPEEPEKQLPQNENLDVLYNFNKHLQFERDNVVDRNKRSIDTKHKIKSQKLKRLLSRQLAALIEEIDAEADETKKPDHSIIPALLPAVPISLRLPSQRYENDFRERDKDDNIIHMVLNHLLLNGITSHIEVYKALHELTKSIKTKAEARSRSEKQDIPQAEKQDIPQTQKPTPAKEDTKLLPELENYKDLQQQILGINIAPQLNKKLNGSAAENKIIINTLIDIRKDDENIYKSNDTTENVKGVVKLLYNGKPIEFATPKIHFPAKTTMAPEIRMKPTMTTSTIKIPVKVPQETGKNAVSKTPEYYLKKALADYAYKYYRPTANKVPNMNEILTKPRPKRQAPITIKNIFTKRKNNSKRHEDAVFLEVETHIDHKDLKSDDKKHKIIKELIDKIQSAIYSNIGVLQKLNKNHKSATRSLQFKKRLLTPVDDKIINKMAIPLEPVEHRRLDPISKIMTFHDKITKIVPATKKYHPAFLSEMKSINSAENGNVHVEYDKTLTDIPQRLQIPLYNDEDDEDVGNIKFSVKNIDGTGLSIGFNHYVDTEPESDVKVSLFDKLAKIMDSFPESFEEYNNTGNSMVKENHRQLLKTMINLHDITKRELNLQHLIENDNKIDTEVTKLEKITTEKPENTVRYEYGFNLKDLLSLEQNEEKLTNELGLDIFDRSKRQAPLIQKVWDVNNKVKLGKYMNTNVLKDKSLLWKKTHRLKRDINNVLLSDITNPGYANPELLSPIPNAPFAPIQDMFDASNENMQLYADAQPRSMETFVGRDGQESYNIFSPPPLILAPKTGNTQNGGLMSKYPHILMERFDKSKEMDLKTKFSMMSDLSKPREHPPMQPPLPLGHIIDEPHDDNMPGLEDLVNAIAPASYKVTVKLAPKNQSQAAKTKVEAASIENEKEADEEKNEEVEERSKRIQSELQGLMQQKETFENLLRNRERENKSKDLIELLLPFNPPKILHLNKEDVSTLIRTALQKLQDLNPNLNIQNNTIITTSTTTTTTTQKSITSGPKTGNQDSGISINDLKSITNEILVKIERNTNYFQTFLKKLTEKLDGKKEDTRNVVFRHLGPAFKGNNNPKDTIQYTNHPKEYMPHTFHQGPLMLPSLPSYDMTNNGTYIPFVYAYQHAVPSNGSKISDNLANVVYHGHIHTNTVPNNKQFLRPQPMNLEKNDTNNTKYFLDELQTGLPPTKLFKLMKKSKK